MTKIIEAKSSLKISTVAGELATVPASSTHEDGTWNVTDVYDGEFLLNTTDNKLYLRSGSAIKQVPFSNNENLIYSFDYTLTSAEILALFSTPKVLVASPGVGLAVVLTELIYTNIFNTTAYAGASTLYAISSGANRNQYQDSTILPATVAKTVKANQNNTYFASDTQILPNVDLILTANTTPTTGNSTIRVRGNYKIIAI